MVRDAKRIASFIPSAEVSRLTKYSVPHISRFLDKKFKRKYDQDDSLIMSELKLEDKGFLWNVWVAPNRRPEGYGDQ